MTRGAYARPDEGEEVNLGTRMTRRDRAAFVGRVGEIRAVAELFVHDPPASVVIVHGPGGIGKRALPAPVGRPRT
jgi:hypothetical protein